MAHLLLQLLLLLLKCQGQKGKTEETDEGGYLQNSHLTISPDRFDAVLFDLDGVVTRTAALHRAAWQILFDECLEDFPKAAPFDADKDYPAYVDGKPRLSGIEDFLASRGIRPPLGGPGDGPEQFSVHGLGTRKNTLFLSLVEKKGVSVYPSALRLIRQLRRRKIKTAVVSSSANCAKILLSAGLLDLFDVRVDGNVASALNLAGKPHPATFAQAALSLGKTPSRCVVVEDALAGVAAGRKGGFGLVIGVNRSGRADALKKNGAHVVVPNLYGIRVARRTAGNLGWEHNFMGFIPGDEGRRETLCALGNGYFVSRGTAPEASADDCHYPGTYMAGCYNRLSTRIHGITVENEDLVNLPNWRCLNVNIEGEGWFSPKDVEILFYRQSLNMKRGILNRYLRIRDEKGRRTFIWQQSFVHGEQMHMAGLKMRLTPLNWSGKITIRSGLDGRVANRGVPRYRALESRHLKVAAATYPGQNKVALKVRTLSSGIEIAMGADTRIFANGKRADATAVQENKDGYIGHRFTARIKKGDCLTVEKQVSVYSSKDTGIYECLEAAVSAVSEQRQTFNTMVAAHATAWELLWREFDFTLSLEDAAAGEETQKIIRLYMFHLLQSSSFHSLDIDVGMPARGWHGEGYRGHIFWDDMIIFPILNYRAPRITRSLLMYRYRRLAQARRAAGVLGCPGALYPWQSGSAGREETQKVHLNPASGRWVKDNTHLQYHVNNSIVYNIWQYFQITQDIQFLCFYGGEIILEIARFWAARAVYDPGSDRYEILGVMGPDEYHDAYPGSRTPGINNNAYTNLMVMFTMNQALNLSHVLPRQDWEALQKRLCIEKQELELWTHMSRRMKLVFHRDGILSQFEGYEDLAEFDWSGYTERYGDISRLDRILETEGDTPNRYKLCKQPDVLMLFYLFSAETLKKMFNQMGYRFDRDFIRKNINYYLARTCNGSSLALTVHAWIQARVSRRGSWSLFTRALKTDMFEDATGSLKEGIHLGAMAGCIDILQRGYAGLEIRSDILILNPLLPSALKRIRFHIRYRKHWLDLEITQNRVVVKSQTNRAFPFTMMVKDEIIKIYPGSTAVVAV